MNIIFQPLFDNGIPSDLIYYLLIIPFIVMFATLARHVFGLRIFTMFTFVSMTLIIGLLIKDDSWFSIGVGGSLLIFIYFFSYFIKKITNNFTLHYFSRISLVITLISILLLTILSIIGRNKDLVNVIRLDKSSSFGIIIAVMLSEYYSSHQTQKGFRASRTAFLTSLFLALIIGSLISWLKFQMFILANPYFVIIFMIITALAGKYKGLRISEMKRFKDIETD